MTSAEYAEWLAFYHWEGQSKAKQGLASEAVGKLKDRVGRKRR